MSHLLLLGWSVGPMELVVVLLIALLLFGTRIPTVMRSLGKGVNEFKAGMKDGEQPSDNSSSTAKKD